MHYQRWKKHGDPHRVDKVASPAKDWLLAHVKFQSSDCLTWPFHVGDDGYGRVHRFDNGRLTTASHMMCELAHGPCPPKYEAAHSCGKGHLACVNPQHLYWATAVRNHADKIEHGTTNRGERQGSHKLTEADVLRIRELAGTRPQTEIGAMFNVSQTHVSSIVTGRCWGWLD